MDLGMITGIVVPVVALVAVFTFIGVATWSDNRRKERETYYRHETYRKLMEHSGESAQPVIDLMHQEELLRAQRRIEGIKLGGMITLVVGIGLMIFLYFLVPEEPVFLIGLIPLLIGLVLLVQGFFMARTPQKPDGVRP